MQALLLVAALVAGVAPESKETKQYFVYQNRMENVKKKVVAKVAKYEYHTSTVRHSKEDDGRRLRIYSTHGYSLENIPLYHTHFYNECMQIFLEIEAHLPKACDCMKKNKQNVRDLKGLRFSFPKYPEIQKDGTTMFLVDRSYTITDDGTYLSGRLNLHGVYIDDEDVMYITLTHQEYSQWIGIHEYIHACGYAHYLDKTKEKETFKCAERKKTSVIMAEKSK